MDSRYIVLLTVVGLTAATFAAKTPDRKQDEFVEVLRGDPHDPASYTPMECTNIARKLTYMWRSQRDRSETESELIANLLAPKMEALAVPRPLAYKKIKHVIRGRQHGFTVSQMMTNRGFDLPRSPWFKKIAREIEAVPVSRFTMPEAALDLVDTNKVHIGDLRRIYEAW